MPQTMQQKRKGSLERLKASITLRTRIADALENPDAREKVRKKIANLTRMIEHTEIAILRN